MKVTLQDQIDRGTVVSMTLALRPQNNGDVTLTIARGDVDEIALDVNTLELLMAARFCHQHSKRLQKEQRP